MTIATTPTYGIAYCDTSTQLNQLADVTSQAATTIEAALIRGGIAPPNAADLAALVGRVSTLETSNALGPLVTSAAGFTAATGWTVGSVAARKLGGGRAYLAITATYTGAGIAAQTVGDIGNVQVCTVPAAWLPLHNVAAAPGISGRLHASYLTGTAGQLFLSSTVPVAVATNEVFTFLLNAYPLANP